MPPKYTKEQKIAYQAKKKLLTKVKKANPHVQMIKGRGDYRPTQFQRVKGRGDYLGDLFGGLAAKAGNWAGNALQGGFRKLTGFGDYQSRGPTRNSLYQRPTQPSESSFEMGSMSVKFAGKAPRVQHREFVGPVFSTGMAFNTKVYRLQPGLTGQDTLFPWGSSVAGCFQQYILHGCIFEYVTTSSDYSANSSLGTVMMSMIYDAEQTPLASQMAVDNNEYTTTAKPSVSFYHPIECSPKENSTDVRYIRKGNNSIAGQDERLDDFGIFQVSTNGLAATQGTQIGELWVTYDIEFLKAELPDIHVGTTWQATGAGLANATMPTALSTNSASSLPVTSVSPGAGQMRLNLPPNYNGNYQLTVTAYFSGTLTSYSLTTTFGSDVTGLKLFPDGFGVNKQASTFGVSGGFATFSLIFSTIAQTAANNYIIVYGGGTFAGAFSTFDFLITALDNDVQPIALTDNERMEEKLMQMIQTVATKNEKLEEFKESDNESEIYVEEDPLSNSTLLDVLRTALRK